MLEVGQQQIFLTKSGQIPIGVSTLPLQGVRTDCNVHPGLQVQPEVLEVVEEVDEVELLSHPKGTHLQLEPSRPSQGNGQFILHPEEFPQLHLQPVNGLQSKKHGGRQRSCVPD